MNIFKFFSQNNNNFQLLLFNSEPVGKAKERIDEIES